MQTTKTWLVVAIAATLGACASTPNEPAATVAVACHATSETEIAALFDRWNSSLATGDPHEVSKNYADRSLLLPTLSNTPRRTHDEEEDYFHHFLENGPVGSIDMRWIDIGCNDAVDAGLYTFTFAKTGAVVHARYTFTYHWNGVQWLITSHHSSAMPEK